MDINFSEVSAANAVRRLVGLAESNLPFSYFELNHDNLSQWRHARCQCAVPKIRGDLPRGEGKITCRCLNCFKLFDAISKPPLQIDISSGEWPFLAQAIDYLDNEARAACQCSRRVYDKTKTHSFGDIIYCQECGRVLGKFDIIPL
jgi:hypothetical protein